MGSCWFARRMLPTIRHGTASGSAIVQRILFGYGGGEITDIEVDPNDPNRIWVSTSRFKRDHKVIMFEYDGAQWQETLISYNLPDFPAYSLAYQKGYEKDVLYVGTGVGVYVNTDASNENSVWECFSEGMPVCVVDEVSINYCSNQLVAATFGHGIWISPLAVSPTERLKSPMMKPGPTRCIWKRTWKSWMGTP
jgi:hypothetical protein